METAIFLTTYAIIPLFCAYMVYITGKEQNKRMDELYEKYNKYEENLLDLLEHKAKYEKKD
jgi:ABC-type transport system involved in cytochrome bd biosynthesis fused ATPase/permease subunit